MLVRIKPWKIWHVASFAPAIVYVLQHLFVHFWYLNSVLHLRFIVSTPFQIVHIFYFVRARHAVCHNDKVRSCWQCFLHFSVVYIAAVALFENENRNM